MRFPLPSLRLVVFGCVLIFSTASHAAITVLRHYRLGDIDPGAANGVAATNSIDSFGTNDLSITGSPLYSADVVSTNSGLSLQFSGTNYGIAAGISNLTDNFGVEAWVKTTTNDGTHYVVYNGNTSANGWGILQSGNVWKMLFGGQIFLGNTPVTTNQWTHLALVRNSGNAILYINGHLRAFWLNSPAGGTGSLGIGTKPESPSDGNWQGGIDEVRIFTFAPDAFTTDDLLLSMANTVPSPLQLGVVQQPNQVVLSWPTNRSAVAETSTDLSSTNWAGLPSAVVANGQFTLTNDATDAARFFRLRRVPCAVDTNQAPLVRINPDMDGEEIFIAGKVPGQPGRDNNLQAGGYEVQVMVDGSVWNFFDASGAISRLACDPADPAPTFKWDIFGPPLIGATLYTARGITGQCGPVMKIAPDSIPGLDDSDARADPYWRTRLTITYQYADQPPKVIIAWFKFRYSQTILDLQMSSDCQQCPGTDPCPTCSFENARPPLVPCAP